MAAMQSPDSDSPPGALSERRRWRPHAEVSVLRRPDHQEYSEEWTRRIGSRDADAGSVAGRHPIVVCCSNAHLAATSPDIPATPKGEVFRWVRSEAKAGPFSLLRLMR